MNNCLGRPVLHEGREWLLTNALSLGDGAFLVQLYRPDEGLLKAYVPRYLPSVNDRVRELAELHDESLDRAVLRFAGEQVGLAIVGWHTRNRKRMRGKTKRGHKRAVRKSDRRA